MSKATLVFITVLLVLGGAIAAAVVFYGETIFALPPQQVVEAPRNPYPIEDATPQFESRHYTFPDKDLTRSVTYYWRAPSPAPATRLPLVIVLHGAPGVAYAAKYLAAPQMQADFPSFILVPQTPVGKAWAIPEKFSGEEFSDGRLAKYDYFPSIESLPDVIAIARRVMVDNPIDPQRIYIIGCSLGGSGVYGAVLRYPDLFAGAIAISGSWSFLDAPRLTHVPLGIMHGTHDEMIPVQISRTMAVLMQKQNNPVAFSEFSDMGHECPAAKLYQKSTWQWLFSHRKKP